MAAAGRRRLRPRAIAMLLLAMILVLPVAISPAAPAQLAAPGAPDEADSQVTVTSVTPMVGEGDEALVRGRVTNTSEETLPATDVSVVPQESTDGRQDLRRWATGEGPILGTPLAQTTLEDIPAGEEATFTLAVEGNDLLPGVAAGAAWVSVQTGDDAVHTFLGVHRAEEYQPLEIVWGVPLLLPPDRRLFGDQGAERTAAWREAVGDDSRIADLTEETPEEDEAWLLDPSLLQGPTDAPAGSPEETRDDAAAEQELRRERATAIREALVADRTIVLPGADADVAAGAESSEAADLVTPRITEGRRLASDLGAHGDVLWPSDGLVSAERTRSYDQLDPSQQQPTVLAPESSLVPDGFTPTGGERTLAGAPLVIRESEISHLVSGLQTTTNSALARQRLIAETSALLGERSGTPRTVFVVPDRGSTPSPSAYDRLRGQAEDIPWVTGGDLPGLLEEAEQAAPGRAPRSEGQLAEVDRRSDPPLLTSARARQVSRDERAMATFAAVRSDGRAWRRLVEPSLDQLTSARWRGEAYQYLLLQDALSEDVTLTEEELVVSSGDVNFFADTGRLQITVINNTDVELSDLTVKLDTGNPSLRIDGPPDRLTIGPNGRQTVTVRASALGAGQVPIDVTVLSPAGQELTAPATMRVTVRPTGDSVYWVIGGAAMLLLGVGTWRTVRGGRSAKGETTTETEERG